MRVLHLLSQRPGATGSGTYLEAMLRCGLEAGDEVAAVVGVSEPAQADLGVPTYPVLLPFPLPGMSDVMPYPSSRWSDLTEPQLECYRTAFEQAVGRAIREFRPDVVHGNHLWLLTSLARRRAPELPMVATCHQTCLGQLQLAPRYREEVRAGVERLDAVLALTEEQRATIGQHYRSPRLRVTGSGYRSDVFGPGAARSRDFVLYAGKLSSSKGVPELLEAWSGPLRLAGGGTGPEAEAIRRRAGAERLLGILPPAELAEQMRRARVFCLPSYSEGAPLVVIEALACGCRVVANDLPGLRSWLGPELMESVELVEGPDRPGDYVERLRRALEWAWRAPEPRCAPLERHTWQSVYRRTREVYVEVAGQISRKAQSPQALPGRAG